MNIEFGGDTTLDTIDTVLGRIHGWVLEVEYYVPYQWWQTLSGAYDGLDPESQPRGPALRFALWDDDADAVSTRTVKVPLRDIRTITIL
jgi:hypothetical protein